MKQVNPKYYNQKYFKSQSSPPDYSKDLSPNDFHKKYQEISSLLELNPQDKICDLGCGTGDLSFLLWLKYQCSIISFDYSLDAINICQQKNKLFKDNYPNSKILFKNKNNQSLPRLKNIKAVYLCDVVEHLYPTELNILLKTISQWGNPNIIIHTDNNIYLKYFEPILHFILLITHKTTKKQLEQTKKFHHLRHVNLTNPNKLSYLMKQFGYIPKLIKYPKLNQDIIKKQLGPLSKFKFLITISTKILQLFPFISPSFYCLYSKDTSH